MPHTMLSAIISNIRESVLGGTSKYLEGELFGGAHVVVCRKGEAPEDTGGYIYVEAENPSLVSAVIFEARDALSPVMSLGLKERLYPRIGAAAFAANKLGANDEETVGVMLGAVEDMLHEFRRAYFAYGSNMDEGQMAVRCPDAELVIAAAADGWQLWMDQAGYATIAEGAGERVEGALWEISVADELELDRYEGVASGCYERRNVRVEGEGIKHIAIAYVSLRTPVTMETFRAGYVERCVVAAKGLGLDGAVARFGEVRIVE